jgi:hypothetical protein
MAKSRLTPLQISGFGYFSHVYKLNTQPCNLHRQTMARSEKLSDFQRGTVIGCHHFNKSVRQISALLEMPQSTVSAVIVSGNV